MRCRSETASSAACRPALAICRPALAREQFQAALAVARNAMEQRFFEQRLQACAAR
jgi:predicted RNA polymerase sigma factor